MVGVGATLGAIGMVCGFGGRVGIREKLGQGAERRDRLAVRLDAAGHSEALEWQGRAMTILENHLKP